MDRIVLIYGRKNPRFFSIGSVFNAISGDLSTVFDLHKVTVPFHSSGLVNILRNVLFTRKQRGTVIHVTGDIHYAVIGVRGAKSVLTIHDCNFLQRYSGIKGKLIKYLFLDLPVKRADMVSTISDKSKREIISATNCREDKIKVIPNPVSDSIYFRHRSFGENGIKVLFIGTTANKNLERSIRALIGLPLELILLGLPDEAQLQQLNASKLNFGVFHDLEEAAVADLYSSADLLLYPSLYEGFGLPIVEAQKAGRVVVTSNIEPMTSVAGEAAILVDPFDEISIRNGVVSAMSNSTLRENLISKGFENIKRFARKRVSEEYINLYKEVLEK